MRELLAAASRGDRIAADTLVPLVYEQLRGMAAGVLANESAEHTLGATALVHEVWLRLVKDGDPGWHGHRHFLGAAARAMRRILVEAARRRRSRPRKAGAGLDTESGIPAPQEVDQDGVLDIDAILTEIEREHPLRAEIVHLRFFAGLTLEDIATMLAISLSTVEREWRYVRAVLTRRLASPPD
jgi:RNA polymerase sigma factor (TIGR02999 family)